MARFGLRATPFLDNKKAGSNAVEIIRGLPRPSQMLPHLPEANRVGTGKEAPRGSPLGTPRYFDFSGHCGTPQWPVTGPSARQYREPFRGEAGVLFRKVGGYGIF